MQMSACTADVHCVAGKDCRHSFIAARRARSSAAGFLVRLLLNAEAQLLADLHR
jgi:hypothetical protein